MLTPGVYDGKVVDAFWSESAKKGTPCIHFKVEIEDLEGPAVLQGDVYFTEKTVGTRDNPGFAIQQLRALGYDGCLGDLHPEPAPLIGKRGKCVVEQTDSGRLRVAQFGVSGAAHVAMELRRLQELDKKLGLDKGKSKLAPKEEEEEDENISF